MNTEQFYKLPKALAMANGFIDKNTGEPIKLTPSSKIIYAYMLEKTRFFTQDMKGQHFECQSTIAKACGLEQKVVGTILRIFLEHGIIEGEKLRPKDGGQKRWHYYKVLTDLVLYEGDTKDFKILEEEKSKYVEKVLSKPTQTHKPYHHQPIDDWDDSQLPF